MYSDKYIEDYLLDQLPLNERIMFESELEEDPVLQKRLKAYGKWIQDLENIGRVSLLEDLDHLNFHEDSHVSVRYPEEKKEFTISPLAAYPLIFIIVLLSAHFARQYDPIKNFSNSRIFSFYFEPISVRAILSEDEYSELNQ